MYKELQSVRGGKRDTHTLDVHSLTLNELDPKIYMVQSSAHANKTKIALFDNDRVRLRFVGGWDLLLVCRSDHSVKFLCMQVCMHVNVPP